MASKDVDIETILKQASTENYYIEYEGFLTNHLPHASIALYRLGHTRERIEHFINAYKGKLEPVTSDPTDNRPAEDLKGERVAYYSIVKYYERLYNDTYNKDIDLLISSEYPKVSEGLGSCALHGTIHLGYGYSVRNVRTVLEGLAYTYHSFRPINTSRCEEDLAIFGQGHVDILDVLTSLRNHESLQDQMFQSIEKEKWKALNVGPVQLAIAYLTAEHADLLTDHVLSLKFNPELFCEDGSIDPVRCMRQVIYWAVVVYALSSTRNNFFLLHGVTCSWSLSQIIPLLTKSDGIKVIREFLTVLLAVYMSQGCPELNVPIVEGDFDQSDWKELVKVATEIDRDEHCYKVVQVCQEMVNGENRLSDENPNVYMQAAKSVLKNEFNFSTYGS